VKISTVAYGDVVAACRNWIAGCREKKMKDARYVCVTSVHGVVTSRKDETFRQILNDADIATPDGMPIVWALRSLGVPSQQRVYGPTLMLKLCEDAQDNDHRIFLYGSTPDCLGRLQRRLEKMFPGIQVVGAYSPPFRRLTPSEDRDIIQQILDSRTELLFVGISTPKQEKWMDAHLGVLSGIVMIGVGAAFDFHAGIVAQAPPWMQRNGLEWLYRLSVEPKRLWRRYLIETPQFLPLWGLQLLRLLRRKGVQP
jgi:N-acetylglucosaminyldiphosphoundecaprenol N-acetyl-beta-D-mannosaminyltransferase